MRHYPTLLVELVWCSRSRVDAVQKFAVQLRLQEVDVHSKQSRKCAPQKLDRPPTPQVQSPEQGCNFVHVDSRNGDDKSATQEWKIASSGGVV